MMLRINFLNLLYEIFVKLKFLCSKLSICDAIEVELFLKSCKIKKKRNKGCRNIRYL